MSENDPQGPSGPSLRTNKDAAYNLPQGCSWEGPRNLSIQEGSLLFKVIGVFAVLVGFWYVVIPLD
jgi:hypothetical protein